MYMDGCMVDSRCPYKLEAEKVDKERRSAGILAKDDSDGEALATPFSWL